MITQNNKAEMIFKANKIILTTKSPMRINTTNLNAFFAGLIQTQIGDLFLTVSETITFI